jgi:hypothetical protein
VRFIVDQNVDGRLPVGGIGDDTALHITQSRVGATIAHILQTRIVTRLRNSPLASSAFRSYPLPRWLMAHIHA